MNSNAKQFVVNGVTIRFRRKQLGWSQVELGHRAGYSERVIRKAEANGTLRLQTIKDLAMTLSVGGQLLTFQDLTRFAPEPTQKLQATLDFSTH